MILRSLLLLGFLVSVSFADPIVSHVKIVSDKVEDVSSLDNWLKSTIKPGMTDAEKARAIWESTVKFRHHDLPDAREFLGTTSTTKIYDAVKMFNVYGYCTGNPGQFTFVQLARHAGLKTRHMSLFRWGVPEVFYDNAWHMYDVGMINCFPKDDGAVASVEEIMSAVKAWHEKNPGYHDKADNLKQYMKDPGFKEGPKLLLNCPTLQPNGSYMFNYFGWASTMLVYNTEKPPGIYEEASSQGYEVNNRLRPGEKLTLNWSNKGMHIGMLDEPRKDPETINVAVGTKQLTYQAKLGDLANSRIGNGTLEYKPRLGDTSREFVIDMPCSYVYLSGSLRFSAEMGDAGAIRVDLSDTNGRSWKTIGEKKTSGAVVIDLQQHVFRRYHYQLKFVPTGKASVRDVIIRHDFQLSQRALPALGEGENTINFSADPSAVGTVTIEHGPAKSKDKQPTAADFGVQLSGIKKDLYESNGVYAVDEQTGDVTYPIETPGDMVRVRMAGHYRAKDDEDAWEFQVSFDDGKTFITAGRTDGAAPAMGKSVTLDQVPKGARKALVRFHGVKKTDLVLNRCRIDADYAYPNASFAPVKATYTWEEDGQEKRDEHIAKSPAETYKITCGKRPTMKSLTFELAE